MKTGKSMVMLLTLALILGVIWPAGRAQVSAKEAEVRADEDAPYTVEFTYDDREFVMGGNSSVSLKEVLDFLGLEGEINAVSVSNEKLFSAAVKDGAWMVTARQAFSSAEWMKVVLDGMEYEIAVTDDIISFTYYNPATKKNQTVAKASCKYLSHGSYYEMMDAKYKAYWQDPIGDMADWFSWYAVDEDLTINDRCLVFGKDINLLLLDGHTLTCSQGIEVPEGSKLTIWAATDNSSAGVKGTGKLIIHASGGNAGIGGSGENAGTIVINGGTITIDGEDGACIGGGSGGNGGNITINDGTITATNLHKGACIGGGKNGNGGTITINGGTITLNETGPGKMYYGAAIGGGQNGNGGVITINDGIIKGNGDYGAAIGGGQKGSSGIIKINGGNIEVSGVEGTGIGGGAGGKGDEIIINHGVISATTSSLAAAIGGGFGAGCGTLIINDGTINAIATFQAAGIGSGAISKNNAKDNHIIINGGEITATSGSDGRGGAGIGGGACSDGGVIEIKNGTVTANGGLFAAGIGGGWGGKGGIISISGGNVTAIALDTFSYSSYGSGIGAGTVYDNEIEDFCSKNLDPGQITISGGTVTAMGGNHGVGIGGTQEGDGGEITISGGTVTAIGGRYGKSGIGCGKGGSVSISGGEINASISDANLASRAAMEGKIQLSYSDDTKDGMKIWAKSYSGELIIADDCYFTDGTRAYRGSISGNALNSLHDKMFCPGAKADYIDDKGIRQGNLECTGVTSEMTELSGSNSTKGWYLVLGEVTLEEVLTINGDVKLILCDDAKLIAKKGINVSGDNSLTIYAQSAGDHMGQLIATGMDLQAGIGGYYDLTGGSITLAGGFISAEGGYLSAGIGGSKGRPGRIRITGSAVLRNVKAGPESDGNAIGVGDGYFIKNPGDNNKIVIDGGVIEGVSKIGGKHCQVVLTYNENGSIPSKPRVKADAFEGLITVEKPFIGQTASGEKTVIMPGTTVHESAAYVPELTDWLAGVTLQPGNGFVINVDKGISNGTVKVENLYNAAQAGDVVTLTAKPGKDCHFVSMKVTDSKGEELALSGSGDTRTFTMPNGPVNVTATFETEAIHFLDPTKTGEERNQSHKDYVQITDQTNLSAGWYAVLDEVEINDQVRINGEVNLILCDNAVLNCYGITIPDGSSLTIWAQSDGKNMGKLCAYGDRSRYGTAGIGGEEYQDAGRVTINGGWIEAQGSLTSAGIGGSGTHACGEIIINGGIVKAVGGSDEATGGAGIGGGNWYAPVGAITINGGTVTAIGGGTAAGIGGGATASESSTITINGGAITANGGSYDGKGGAGIGSGAEGKKMTIIVNGGEITATGGAGASAIGDGTNAASASTLSLYEQSNVTAGSDKENAKAVEKDARVEACKKNAYARIDAIYYRITSSAMLGSVTTDPMNVAMFGETVTITLTPQEQCVFSSLIVMQDKTEISVRKQDDRTYTFNMPEGDVNVTATFKKMITPEVVITDWIYGDYNAKKNGPGLTEDANPGQGEVSYFFVSMNDPDGNYVEQLPTNAGKYVVKAVIAETDGYTGGEATASFEIKKRDLTITAKETSKTYGEKDPELNYETDGLMESDEIRGALRRKTGEDVGDYEIMLGTLTAGENYQILYVEAKFAILQAKGEAPGAPSLDGVTMESVTLTAGEGLQFSMDGITWQDGNVFEGLQPNQEYTFYQRYAETKNYKASPASEGKIVKTLDGQYVTFMVKGGAWDDGSTDDVAVLVTGQAGEMKLQANQIPAVGNKPGENHRAGSWNVVPDVNMVITVEQAYIYTYGTTCEGEIQVQADLTGREWTDGDAFEFTISAAAGTPMPENASITVTKNSANYAESFGKISFTEPGEYGYVIAETHKGEEINGVSYDSADKTVKIKIKDDGKGNLVADGTALVQTISFTNSYQEPVLSYEITWLMDDGSLIDTTTVEYGKVPTHADAVKADTEEYAYTFTGWNVTPVAVTGEATYKAVFEETKKSTGENPGGSTPGGSTPGGSTPGGSTPGGSTTVVTNKTGDYLDELRERLRYAIALGGEQSVYWNKGTSLPKDVLKTLEDHPSITLVFEYVYENVKYSVTLPGKNVKTAEGVEWYGPVYLYCTYGKAEAEVETSEVSGIYVVKSGDTLSRIARKLQVKQKYLVDLNKIKNPDYIRAGQVLKY